MVEALQLLFCITLHAFRGRAFVPERCGLDFGAYRPFLDGVCMV
jgi:hypothetical protein